MLSSVACCWSQFPAAAANSPITRFHISHTTFVFELARSYRFCVAEYLSMLANTRRRVATPIIERKKHRPCEAGVEGLKVVAS
jgi:hypothetical protein